MTLEPIKRAEKLSHIMFRKLLYFGCPTNSVWARSYDHLKVNGMSEPDPFINQWREIPWIVWKFWDFRAIAWHKTPFKMIVRPSYFVSRLYSSPPPILKVWTSYDNSKSVKSHIFIQNVGHDRPQMTVLAWNQNIGFDFQTFWDHFSIRNCRMDFIFYQQVTHMSSIDSDDIKSKQWF